MEAGRQRLLLKVGFRIQDWDSSSLGLTWRLLHTTCTAKLCHSLRYFSLGTRNAQGPGVSLAQIDNNKESGERNDALTDGTRKRKVLRHAPPGGEKQKQKRQPQLYLLLS